MEPSGLLYVIFRQKGFYLMHSESYYKKNFFLGLFHEGIAGLGNGFVVPATILTVFLSYFTSSKVLIGMIFTLPVIINSVVPFVGGYFTRNFKYKKPPSVCLHFLIVACWLILGLLTFSFIKFKPGYPVLIFFVLYGFMTFISGISSPLYIDYIGKIITKSRGLFFGISLAVNSSLSILGAFFAKNILANVVFPANYAFCFLVFVVAASFSAVLLWLTKEGDEENIPKEEKPHLKEYIGKLLHILKKDKIFRNILLIEIIINFAGMSSPFYAVYAFSKFKLNSSMVGNFTIMLVLGQAIAGFFLGRFADKKGHRFVLSVAVFCAIGAALFAVFGNSPSHFYSVFFLLGVSSNPAAFSITNLILDLGKGEKRSLYLTLNYTVSSLFGIIPPVLGGFLIGKISYHFVFILTAAILTLGFLISIFSMKNNVVGVPGNNI